MNVAFPEVETDEDDEKTEEKKMEMTKKKMKAW